MCLNDVLLGQLDLQNWQSEARQIPPALVVDCRGGRRFGSFFVLLSWFEVTRNLAWKRLLSNKSLVECGTMIRWCRSACLVEIRVACRLVCDSVLRAVPLSSSSLLKQTSVYTSCKVQKLFFRYVMLRAQYLLSALSKVATSFQREHVFVALDDDSSRITNVLVCSRLERCSLWWVSLSAQLLAIVFFFQFSC